ncbi:hypothetical protein TM239_01460 [Bradyrhizobium sp. TM239]|nr:hypothetical protein TM239_01460 [Bradyrhizobium sp. TM239]
MRAGISPPSSAFSTLTISVPRRSYQRPERTVTYARAGFDELSENARWLLTSGTPGLAIDGKLPSDIAGQADMVAANYRHAGVSRMTMHVKVTHYLLRAEDIPAYVEVRTGFL